MSKQYSRPMLTGRPARTITRADGLIEFRENGTNWLLCLFDPERRVLQIQRRNGTSTLADLKEVASAPLTKPE